VTNKDGQDGAFSELERLEEALSKAKRNEDYQQLRELFPQIANYYLQQGQAPQALTWIQEGLEITEKEEDVLTRGRLKGLEGLALRQIGNPKQALRAFRRSAEMGREIDHRPILMDALSQIGKLQAEQGNYDQAVLPLERAYRMAFEDDDLQRQIFLAGLQGDTYLALEQAGKAMEFYAIGLEKAQQLGKLEPQCSYQIAIGKIYLEKEDYGPAEEHFKNALDIGSRLKHAGYEFQAFENLLRMSIQKDDLDSAVFHGKKAVQLARDIADVGGEAENISRLVDYLMARGKHEQALNYLNRGLELAEEAHDQEWQLKMIADQGIAHYYVGNLSTADQKITKALEMAQHLQRGQEEAVLRSQLSSIKAEGGDFQESLAQAERTLQLAEDLGLEKLSADQWVLMGLNHLEMGNSSRARELVERGLDVYQSLDRTDLVREAQKILTEIDEGAESE